MIKRLNPHLNSGGLENRLLAVFLFFLLTTSCGGRETLVPYNQPLAAKKELPKMDYAIQVGAFSNLMHAIRLTEALQERGLDAYYFVHATGIYKVRFGNLPSSEMARGRAKALKAAGIIDDYYIVGPEQYPTGELFRSDKMALRDRIVGSARKFIGVPYTWGGTSRKTGFDCSGLAMAVYQLNGLNLPRSSSAQWHAGAHVDQAQMSKADLVFFATSRGSRISHVGIYVGSGRFIHAPGHGKNIRITSLSNPYFEARFRGARTYL